MKTRAATISVNAVRVARLTRPAAYVALTKPDVSFLVVLTTAAGFLLSDAASLDWLRLVCTVGATTLVAAGTSALNHYVERDLDAHMRRTALRPLPSGVLAPVEALWFGIGLTVTGAFGLLLTANALAAFLGVAACVSYLGVYTPLKTRTTLATFVGSFPGAIPPLIGWAAARGSLGPGAWVLFAILFLWQFPHFHAISWMYREDYARAGIRMLPVVDTDGKATFAQIVFCAVVLIPVSLLASLTGVAGIGYFFPAVVVGFLLVVACLWAAAVKTNVRAKWLMHATVLHLPLLLGLMLYDRFSN